MGRSTTTLAPPDKAADYTAFPCHVHRAGLRLHRAHRKTHNPWFFSSGRGRFDLSTPGGTVNLASSAEVATRESLGKVLVGARRIPAASVAGKRVSALEVPRTRFADFVAGGAAAHGIVAGDVSAPMKTYDTTQQWAAAMAKAGFEGIRSRSRFGTGVAPLCYYRFGDAGQHELGGITETKTMRDVLESMPGMQIDPTPASTALIIDP
ncbi:RES family NAD+ phosphorylase [Microbacterium sp. PRF11]|uniref:RES family NAD+ phosphorylase n=1 Tax=Microbacterium sp. PRF11 TaxID=2962593 RepID=UPI002881B63C|nr:RES family NAD+ phosphorylase [Microbacterium sp. PRF11]MDT0116615.1 RES family NAD+ phosphorylase [Microbacterium sp. PRF11]